MKHATGKKNLDIVRDYLSGERPFIQVGYNGNQDKYIIRKDGETWTDANGKQWIQKEGGAVAVTPIMDLIRAEGLDKCSCCGAEVRWGSRLDRKMYAKTRKCFDCLIKEETELRIKGQYRLYEAKKILENQLSYLQGIKKQLKEAHTYSKEHKVFTYVNSNGMVEEWANETRDELLKNIKKDFVACLKTMKKVEDELKEVNSEISKVLAS